VAVRQAQTARAGNQAVLNYHPAPQTITTAREQALTPGEKNLGVAVLGMIWGLPMLAFGATGVCLLLVHSVVFLYRRFRPS
jgi:hypothetical protein